MKIKEILETMQPIDPVDAMTPDVMGVMRMAVYTSAYGAAMADRRNDPKSSVRVAEQAVASFNAVLTAEGVKEREPDPEPETPSDNGEGEEETRG